LAALRILPPFLAWRFPAARATRIPIRSADPAESGAV
jgi:hypothetical protein